jgi:hypothetical protein
MAERKEMHLEIAKIVRDDRYQNRKQTDSRLVERYAAKMKDGETFPPLTVAKVAGVLYLIEGFHRLAAIEKLPDGSAEFSPPTANAIVIECTEAEAAGLAAESNLRHGQPLKPRDANKVFELYMKAGKYKNARGGYKSYRTIANEIGGMKSHVTVRKWMKKDHREIARAMGGNDPVAGGGPRDRVVEENALVVAAIQDVRNAVLRCLAIPEPAERQRVIEATAAGLGEMRGEKPLKPEEISPEF